MNRVKLGDILQIKHGYAFKSENYVDKSPYALVTLANISSSNNFQFTPEKTTYYGADFPDEFKLYEDDLIMPLTEQVVGLFGNSAFVPPIKGIQFVLNQRVGKVIPKDGKADKYYLHYLLSTDTVRDQLEYRASGTRQRNISPDDVYDVTVVIPDIEIQRKIGKILYGLERKINLNSKINDNLQHQLKLIYDYWFTQFDFPDENGKPYRSSGGAMAWNDELQRDIPVGWECKTLCDLLIKNSEVFDFGKIEPTIDLSVMPSGSISLHKLNSSDQFTTNLFVMHEGDILFGSIRPYLKKAGIAPCNGVVAGTVHSYCAKNDEDYNFVLFTLCRDSFFDYALSVSTGTKMPVINSDNILSYKVPYSKDIVKLFNKVKIKNIICKNIQEIQRLSQLRDWLLPMLMNGQVGFKDEKEENPQIKISGFEKWLANQGFAARGDVDMDVLRDIYEAMDSDDK